MWNCVVVDTTKSGWCIDLIGNRVNENCDCYIMMVMISRWCQYLSEREVSIFVYLNETSRTWEARFDARSAYEWVIQFVVISQWNWNTWLDGMHRTILFDIEPKVFQRLFGVDLLMDCSSKIRFSVWNVFEGRHQNTCVFSAFGCNVWYAERL